MSEFLIVSQPATNKYREKYEKLFPLTIFYINYNEVKRQLYWDHNTKKLQLKYKAYNKLLNLLNSLNANNLNATITKEDYKIFKPYFTKKYLKTLIQEKLNHIKEKKL